MSGSLDALRKHYGRLTPFERSVMAMEAVERMDQGAVGVLNPHTLWDAFSLVGNSLAFMTLAFTAVHESQKGEMVYLASQIMLKSADSTELSTWLEQIQCGKRSARAWLLALEALDKETGGACMPCARIFAGEYISYIMGLDADKETDYSVELERLRELWAASMEPEQRKPVQ